MRMQERECPNQGEHLGMGFDSLKEKLVNSAIELGENEEEKLKSEAEKFPLHEYCSFKQIENKAMLSRSLNISVSGSLSGEGMIGAVPCFIAANAKGAYFSSSNQEIKQENLYILLNYQLENPAYRIRYPRLSINAQKILNNSSDSTEFRKKYGDEFIIGFRTGAEYTALIEVSRFGTNEKDKVYSDIKATLSSILIEGHGNLEDIKNIAKSLNQYSIEACCFRRPANKGSGLVTSLEQLIFDFLEFKKNMSKKGCVKQTAIFADYDEFIDNYYSIITPELKRLKSKLNRLKSIKIRKKLKLLEIENQVRLEGRIDQNENLEAVINNIYNLDEFIDECLYLPDSINNTERYEKYLKMED